MKFGTQVVQPKPYISIKFCMIHSKIGLCSITADGNKILIITCQATNY